MRADFSDPPVCGTACELCVGHFCPAKGWLDNKPVCRECGEGKPCARALAVKKAMTPLDGSELTAAAPTKYERRCSDCKLALSDLIVGELCSRCRKRLKEIATRQAAAAERAAAIAAMSANLSLGKATK